MEKIDDVHGELTEGIIKFQDRDYTGLTGDYRFEEKSESERLFIGTFYWAEQGGLHEISGIWNGP
jgi:hypothetical protein